MNSDYLKSVYKCYWLFRWGYQRLFLLLRFKKYEKLSEDERIHDDSDELKKAHEKLAAAEFACKFGKLRDQSFREFIKQLQQENIATCSELRALIEGGDLREKKDGDFRIKAPIFSVMSGILFILICLFAMFAFSLLIVLSPATLPIKIMLLLIFNGLFFGCAYIFDYYTINPYRIFRKLKPDLDIIISRWRAQKLRGDLQIVS